MKMFMHPAKRQTMIICNNAYEFTAYFSSSKYYKTIAKYASRDF